MLRKKVLGIGTNSATLLVQDTEANNALRVLRRINVGDLSESAVKRTHQFYERLLNATAAMPAIVQVHTVLMQNAFLNIITSYGAGGDLSTFLEDELTEALPEKTALQWLLVIASAVKQLREAARTPFYGLSLERVYLTEKVSGETDRLPATVVVGLPVPLDAYEKALIDRMDQGVAVEREYPPEVVAKRSSSGFDPSFSDVWVLGSVGARLLSANAPLASRSSKARELISHMTADTMRDRYTLDQVIKALTALVGSPQMPPRERATPSAAAKDKPASSTASDAPALQRTGHRHRHTPQQRVQTPTRDAGKPAAWQEKAQVQFDALKRMNSGTTGSPLTRTHSRGIGEASPPRQRVPSRPAGGGAGRSRPSSRTGSAQRLRRSETSNSALRPSNDKGSARAASPLVSTSTGGGGGGGRGGGGGDGPSSRSATPNNAKIRDLLAEQQENMRLRRERLRHEREQQRKQQGYSGSGRGEGTDGAGTLEPETESTEAPSTSQGNIRQQIQEWRQKMAADNAAVKGAADGERDGVLVFTPPPLPSSPEAEDAAGKRAKARKVASPAVRRLAVSPCGSGDQDAPPRMSTPDARSFANLKGNQAPIHYTRQKEIPITVAVPKGFEEDDGQEARGRTGRGGTASSPSGAARRRPASRQGRQEWVGTVNTPDSSTGCTPPDAALMREAPQPTTRAVGATTPPREPPSRTADPQMVRPHAPQTRAHIDPAASASTDQSVDSTNGAQPCATSSDRVTQMTLQCAVDALRTSIRNMCRDRNLYGQTMVITSEFARQSEAIRTAPRANEEFMRRLKEGLADNRLFAAAAPLCAQLVALEGLEHSIFEAQRAQHRGSR